jgi:hypothetical protein
VLLPYDVAELKNAVGLRLSGGSAGEYTVGEGSGSLQGHENCNAVLSTEGPKFYESRVKVPAVDS